MLFRKLLLTVLQLICLLKTQGYYSVVPTFRSSSFSSRVIRNDLKFSVYTKTRLFATQTPKLSLGAGGINNLPPFFPNDDKASTIESISDILPSTNRHKTAWLTSSVAFALAFLFPTPAKALVLKTYKSLTPFQKIATIPVFYICDRHGNAYFQHNTNDPSEPASVLNYFMSYDDAFRLLSELNQDANASPSRMFISCTTLENVLTLIQSKKQSRKLGRYPVELIYRLQASNSELMHATHFKADFNELGIPVFATEGLVIQRPSGELISPFYFAYDDLLHDWTQLRKKRPDLKLPQRPKAFVKDFADVMALADGNMFVDLQGKNIFNTAPRSKLSVQDATKALSNPGLVPSRKDLDVLRSYYQQPPPFPGEFSKARPLKARK